MSDVRPTSITADRQTGHLAVTWSDGHQSLIPFYLLRYACPCAECRGGHANMGSDPEPEWFTRSPKDTPATHLRNLEMVGAYAITIEWEDGHHFGIYNWRFLRALCPCPDCRAV